MAIRVILVDDHTLVREGLAALSRSQADIRIIAQAEDGWRALEIVKTARPHVVIMDAQMAKMNGFEATQRIRSDFPSTRVVILSPNQSREFIYQALRSGAYAFLPKSCSTQELLDAVRQVHRGSYFVNAYFTDILLAEMKNAGGHTFLKGPLDRLTQREREIMQLTVEGMSGPESAAFLHVANSTVDTHRSRLMLKLGVPNLAALVKFAIQHGITDLSWPPRDDE